MKYTIDSRKAKEISLSPNSRSSEIMQNIAIIMNTPKGSVPGYRQFGMDMSYLHRPKATAKTLYTAALFAAIKAFEPRAKLDGVSFADEDDDGTGVLIPILEVTIDE